MILSSWMSVHSMMAGRRRSPPLIFPIAFACFASSLRLCVKSEEFHAKAQRGRKARKEDSSVGRRAELFDGVAVWIGAVLAFGAQKRPAAARQPAQQPGAQLETPDHEPAHQPRWSWKPETGQHRLVHHCVHGAAHQWRKGTWEPAHEHLHRRLTDALVRFRVAVVLPLVFGVETLE